MTYQPAEAQNVSKNVISEVASIISEQLNYDFTDEKAIFEVVERLGGNIEVQDFWDFDSKSAGSIEVDGVDKFTIYLASHTHQKRDRFTIAHELGHYYLHYLFKDEPKPIAADRYPDGSSDRAEWEANWFAASFLMPREKFKEIFNQKNDIKAVAESFNVSVRAAELHAEYLGLINN